MVLSLYFFLVSSLLRSRRPTGKPFIGGWEISPLHLFVLSLFFFSLSHFLILSCTLHFLSMRVWNCVDVWMCVAILTLDENTAVKMKKGQRKTYDLNASVCVCLCVCARVCVWEGVDVCVCTRKREDNDEKKWARAVIQFCETRRLMTRERCVAERNCCSTSTPWTKFDEKRSFGLSKGEDGFKETSPRKE